VTPTVLQDIRNHILHEHDIYIRTELVFITDELNPISRSVEFVRIENRNRNPFLSFLASGCLLNDTTKLGKNHIGTEFYVTGMQSAVLLNKTEVEPLKVDEQLQIRVALALKCSKGNTNELFRHQRLCLSRFNDR
jgi:hypothetical protein